MPAVFSGTSTFIALRGLLVAAIGLFAALTLWTTEAGATVFCVQKPDCVGTDKATIEDALETAALNNNGADTVYIGANGGTIYKEKISYADAETVHIIGDGRGETIVEADVGSVTATLLSPNSTIESLTLRVPDTGNGMGLRWDATATDIQVVHDGSTATSTLGMRAEGNAVLDASSVSIQGFGLFETLNGNNVTIEDSTLIGAGRGIVNHGGGLDIERSQVWSRVQTTFAGDGASLNVYNTLLRLTETSPASSTSAIDVPSGGEALLRHVTMVGAGQGRAITVSAQTDNAKVVAFDSIIDNFELGVLCAGIAPYTATLAISYSDNTAGGNVGSAACAETFSNNLNVDPGFVNPNSILPIYRLQATSPLIDAGDPTDPLTVDFAGNPRKVDGDGIGGARADIGAYEYQRQAPKPKLTVTPAAAQTGQVIEFSGKGTTDPDPGDTLTYQWDFGDGTGAVGQTVQHAYATGGTKAVTLTVTDSAGAKATATATVQVSAPPPPPPPPPPPKAVLSGLKAVPKRIAIGKGAPKLVPGGRKGFLFTLSTASEVVLELARCTGAKGCVKQRKVPGSARFASPAGSNAIRFKGRFKGRTLKPGRYVAKLSVPGGNGLSARFDLR